MKIGAREFAREQLARRLAEDPGAVAGAPVGSACPAVGHRRHRLQREPHELVGCGPTEVRKEADPARVVFFDDEWRSGVQRGGRSGQARHLRFRLYGQLDRPSFAFWLIKLPRR